MIILEWQNDFSICINITVFITIFYRREAFRESASVIASDNYLARFVNIASLAIFDCIRKPIAESIDVIETQQE